MWELQASLFELVLSVVVNIFVLLVGFLLHQYYDQKSKRNLEELRGYTAQLRALRGNDDALRLSNGMLRKEIAALTAENHALANRVVALTAELEKR